MLLIVMLQVPWSCYEARVIAERSYRQTVYSVHTTVLYFQSYPNYNYAVSRWNNQNAAIQTVMTLKMGNVRA